MKKTPTVYSVRRARKELTYAIRDEMWSTLNMIPHIKHSSVVAKREAAVRALIASVRREEQAVK